jgi:c-di-GMP-binding flagellar brake protein YcgR
MENFISGEDKRRYKRIGASLPLEYKDLRKSSQLPKESLLKNISEGGISFSSKEFMSLACRLVLSITLPGNPKPIKAISKVAWIRRMPVGDQYELGNQFLEIAKEDRSQIVDFVNSSISGASL